MKSEQDRLKSMFPHASASTLRCNPVFDGHGKVPSAYEVAEHEQKRSKYGNIKVEHDGLKFDSKKELQCWLSLQLRQKLCEISGLDRQVVFPLVVNNITVGRFTADFVWLENGEKVVADCKSPPTRKETAYRLRKRIFEAVYHPLTIREL